MSAARPIHLVASFMDDYFAESEEHLASVRRCLLLLEPVIDGGDMPIRDGRRAVWSSIAEGHLADGRTARGRAARPRNGNVPGRDRDAVVVLTSRGRPRAVKARTFWTTWSPHEETGEAHFPYRAADRAYVGRVVAASRDLRPDPARDRRRRNENDLEGELHPTPDRWLAASRSTRCARALRHRPHRERRPQLTGSGGFAFDFAAAARRRQGVARAVGRGTAFGRCRSRRAR